MPIINYLQKQSITRIWVTALLLSVAMSELITGIMSLLLQGKISSGYLLTGFVASLFVAGVVVAVLVTLLNQLQKDAKQLQLISENLRKSEETISQAMRASHSALWDLDLTTWNIFLSDGWAPFLCGEVKPTFTNLNVLHSLVPEEERPMLNVALIAAMKGENNSEYNVVHRVKKMDGNYIWVQSEGRVTQRDQNGRALRMTGINRDITDLKIAEDQINADQINAQIKQIMQSNTQLLEANRQLEQAQNQLLQSEKMASIGLLAAGVAHEINNPISYVNSNLGTLKKYLSNIFSMLDKYESALQLTAAPAQALDELLAFKEKINLEYLQRDTKDLLAESLEGLDHVKKIVADLKDFSHSESEETWKSTDVQQVLETCLNMVWSELKYKCEVRKEYSPLPKVFCLPSRLNQVFINLLLNAAQAIKDHGVITLRTGQEGDQVWIEVEDTGEGIDPKNINRIFDPFFTTKPVGQGTGLGLALSYRIIEKHLGRIEVRSKINKGSVFRVWLPVKQPNGIVKT